MPSIQETLERFIIDRLDISERNSVLELLFEFKRIKYIVIRWVCSKNDKLGELKLETKQFETKLSKKHSQIQIYIHYLRKDD